MISEILQALAREDVTCQNMLHMTSYENRMSRTARQFLESDLGNRYHLSTPQSYNGDDMSIQIAGFSCRALKGIHQLELAAIDAVKEMFGAEHAELRLVSGVHATLATIATMTQPEDIVYSIAPEDGGHFATRQVAESLGRISRYLAWDNERLNIDLEASHLLFKKSPPALLFLDHGTPLFKLPVSALKALLPLGALLVYDASHTLGLIAGGCFQQPLFEGADILQGNTHKTFPGPQKAMILFRDEALGKRYSDAVSLGLVSSQHTHHSIALGITILEMHEHGRRYARDMLENAQVLGSSLLDNGIGLLSYDGCFTTSHELLISSGWHDGYLPAVERLFRSGISVNGRIAFSRPTIRIGVQEITRRGMKAPQMFQIARFFQQALQSSEVDSGLFKQVHTLNRDFPNIDYSFDRTQ
ncbi:TPA: hypothetical protein OUI23_000151 [Pseudomonas aeruginosa]|nr:hypothetical protein [Pseudomonas aeruginosa]